MAEDRYGLTLSTRSSSACEAYCAAADLILAGNGGEEELLERAIADDPAFALAHAALARSRFLRARIPAARESIALARKHGEQASERERSHVGVLSMPIEGKTAEALEATRTHLGRWPRDAMVAAPATGVFGLIGFGGQPGREDDMDAFLEWLAPSYEGDWWFDSVKAFAECETGRLDLARARVERSLEANASNAHGAHVKAHVLYELHEDAEAMRFLDAWMPGCGKQALMHCHLSWHLAITALALGQSDRAWQVYRKHIHPGGAWGPPINIVSDAAAFLWRAELAGATRAPELWRDLRDYCTTSFPKAGVFFADVHTALALVATGDTLSLRRLVTVLRERVAAGRLPPGEVVPNIVEAFGAYGEGDWNRAIRLLEKALPETVRIGGSRAQRDVVAKTLFAAYFKAGRPEDARRMARH
jgi:tetratricopeptide (TPR) repeat protein